MTITMSVFLPTGVITAKGMSSCLLPAALGVISKQCLGLWNPKCLFS